MWFWFSSLATSLDTREDGTVCVADKQLSSVLAALQNTTLSLTEEMSYMAIRIGDLETETADLADDIENNTQNIEGTCVFSAELVSCQHATILTYFH